MTRKRRTGRCSDWRPRAAIPQQRSRLLAARIRCSRATCSVIHRLDRAIDAQGTPSLLCSGNSPGALRRAAFRRCQVRAEHLRRQPLRRCSLRSIVPAVQRRVHASPDGGIKAKLGLCNLLLRAPLFRGLASLLTSPGTEGPINLQKAFLCFLCAAQAVVSLAAGELLRFGLGRSATWSLPCVTHAITSVIGVARLVA